MNERRGETFEEFKDSFWYGSRNDLHFKFLHTMSDEDAGEFLRQLLETLGDVFDTGDYDRVRRLVYEWQAHAYSGERAKFPYEEGPFTKPTRVLRDSTVALISAGGVYIESEDPTGGEAQEEAVARIDDYLREAPTLVTIPDDAPTETLRVRHPGYDIRAAVRDIGVIFPVAVLTEMVADGVVGAAAARHYGFVGAASQLQLRNEVAPRWAEDLLAEDIDACLLVAT